MPLVRVPLAGLSASLAEWAQQQPLAGPCLWLVVSVVRLERLVPSQFAVVRLLVRPERLGRLPSIPVRQQAEPTAQWQSSQQLRQWQLAQSTPVCKSAVRRDLACTSVPALRRLRQRKERCICVLMVRPQVHAHT